MMNTRSAANHKSASRVKNPTPYSPRKGHGSSVESDAADNKKRGRKTAMDEAANKMEWCVNETDDAQHDSSKTELVFDDSEIYENFHALRKILAVKNDVMCMKQILKIVHAILTSPWPWNLWKDRYKIIAKGEITSDRNTCTKGHICLPVNSSVEKWFMDALEHSKLETEDFFIYLLLVYSQINSSILTGDSTKDTAAGKPNDANCTSKGQELQVKNRRTKYTEFALSNLSHEITTLSVLFLSSSSENQVTSKSGENVAMSPKNLTKVSGGKPCAFTTDSKSSPKVRNKKIENTQHKKYVGLNRPGVRNKKIASTQSKKHVKLPRGRPIITTEPFLALDDQGSESEMRTGTEITDDAVELQTIQKKQYTLHRLDNPETETAHKYNYVYECKLCQKVCNGWSSWYHHRNTHLEKRPDHVCPTCGWRTKTRAGMWAHRKKHGDIREKCPHCDYSNCLKSAIRRHIVLLHPDLSEKKRQKYHCDTCGRDFNSSSNLSAHKKLHKELVRNMVCSICGKAFYSKKLLQDHVRSVHSDKRYSCDDCPLRFAKRRSLQVHIERVHLRIKKLKCDYENCNQLFYEKKDVQQHIIVHHTKEKKYECEWEGCKHVFRTQSNRKVHMRIHTGEKPLQCPRCDYTARQRNSLTCHLKKHAKEDGGELQVKPRAKRQANSKALKPKKINVIMGMPEVPDPNGSQGYGFTPLPPTLTLANNSHSLLALAQAASEANLPVSSTSVHAIPSDAGPPHPCTTASRSAIELATTCLPYDPQLATQSDLKPAIVNLNIQGNSSLMSSVLDISMDDCEKSRFRTRPVVNFFLPNQGPGEQIFNMLPNGAEQSVQPMMTVPVFTAEELANMTSLPMMTVQHSLGSTMESFAFPLTTDTGPGTAVLSSQNEPQKFLSMPTFSEIDGFENSVLLKTDSEDASEDCGAAITTMNVNADTSQSGFVLVPSISTTDVLAPGILDDRSGSHIFTTVSSVPSQIDPTPGVVTTSSLTSQLTVDTGCSSEILGALRQLDPSFQTVQLHQLVQQPLPGTTCSSAFNAGVLPDNNP